ncbi:endonuclease domain-containing 1 protein-like [Aplochiton taeniatus]
MCPLLLYLLALALTPAPRLVAASVSDSFRDCGQFFYMSTVPRGIRGVRLRKICQRYGDRPRYATLYDGSRRLPLYSAYTFKKSDGRTRADTPWMYEPQLASGDEGGDMKVLPPADDPAPLIEESQAVLVDYVDAIEYERGTLHPDLHQATIDDKASTYTLTNVVPMATDFLDASWRPYMDAIRRRLNNFCRGKSYVVTGATVSGASLRRGNDNRLSIPKHLWLAYCCPRYDRNSPYEVRFMFPSYGGYARNEQMDHEVVEVPLKILERFLKSQTDVDQNVAIFYKDCVSENTTKKRRRDLT